MSARRAGALAGLITLAGSGLYVFVYLYRWEWNRAQISSSIFIAVEVGLIGWLLADRLRRVERRLDLARADAERRRLETIRSTQPAPRAGFAWLAKQDGMGVFVPVLLGAGAVLSALAWIVERVARSTAGVVAEHGLASRLSSLDLPPSGFLDGGDDPLALLRGPVR